VQLQTDANNQRSRTAIEGIGAVMEGMMRKERIRSNGEFRTTVMYSIIDDEWPAVKQLLQNRLDKYK
jgi:RimJ/RimL family protein N-acetyltransferase